MQANRYISDDFKKINFDSMGIVICIKEDEAGIYGMGFSGKRSKPDFSYRFKSIEQRESYVDKYLNNIARRKEERAARLAQKKAFNHTLKVGDVLYSSWGFDQTNIDFYEVVEVVSAKSVKIREISSITTDEQGSFMTAYKIPAKGKYVDEAVLKRVGEHNYITICKGQWASPWDGKPLRYSWYA